MVGAILLLTGVSMGVNTGWQPTASGEMEYIIQIEPQLLKSLQPGDDLVSEVPIDLRSVRRYRIVVGTGELPRIRPNGDAAARREAASSPQALDQGRGVPRTFADPATTAPGSSVLNQGKVKGASPSQPVAEVDDEDERPAGPALGSVLVKDPSEAIDEPAVDVAKEDTFPAPDPLDSVAVIKDASADVNSKKAAVAESAVVEFPKLPDRYQPPADFSEPKRMVPVHKPEKLNAGQLASHDRTDKTVAAENPAPIVSAKQDVVSPASAEQPRPWMPLVLASLGFVASVGANVYLVWIWLDTRRRYFQLAHAQRAAV